MKRLRAALRTNDIQTTSVLLMTALNACAALSANRPLPWWGWALALGMYPAIAFVGNIFSPIPQAQR